MALQIIAYVVALIMVVGACFSLLAAVGLVRFPTFTPACTRPRKPVPSVRVCCSLRPGCIRWTPPSSCAHLRDLSSSC